MIFLGFFLAVDMLFCMGRNDFPEVTNDRAQGAPLFVVSCVVSVFFLLDAAIS